MGNESNTYSYGKLETLQSHRPTSIENRFGKSIHRTYITKHNSSWDTNYKPTNKILKPLIIAITSPDHNAKKAIKPQYHKIKVPRAPIQVG
jgi:hypothetical protein